MEAVKLVTKGWIEDNEEEYSNVPKQCPKCGGKLMKTDVLSLCNILFVGCKDYKCRWCELYEL